MGLFDRAGEYDENSFWYFFRSTELRALDQALKARAEASMPRVVAMPAAPAGEALTARLVDLEGKLLAVGLYARTILQLLVDKSLITEEEFAQRLRELDLLDGRQDGR